MRFEEVLPERRAGKKIKRRIWNPRCHLSNEARGLYLSDLLADDWEVVEEAWELMSEALIQAALEGNLNLKSNIKSLAEDWLRLKAVADVAYEISQCIGAYGDKDLLSALKNAGYLWRDDAARRTMP